MNDTFDAEYISKEKSMINGFEVVNADKLGQYNFDQNGNLAA